MMKLKVVATFICSEHAAFTETFEQGYLVPFNRECPQCSKISPFDSMRKFYVQDEDKNPTPWMTR